MRSRERARSDERVGTTQRVGPASRPLSLVTTTSRAYTPDVTDEVPPSQPLAPAIDSWQIWHVYSTYLPKPIHNLHQAAADLVAANLVDAVMVSDGTSIWRTKDGGIGVGETTVDVEGRGTRAEIGFPDPLPPPYALEGLFVGAYMRYGEQHAFGEESPVPYLRAILGECRLEKNGHATTLYPVLKLYATGVLLVELRVFSPPEATAFKEFVVRFENLAMDEFTTAHVPPAVARFAPFTQNANFKNPFRRLSLALAGWLHTSAVEERTTDVDGGDFSYQSCELPIAEGSRETLAGLALTIASVAAYIVSRPRHGLALVVRGQRPILSIGDWTGRPHVYLLRFDGQEDSAAANESKFRAAFGCILARVPNLTSGDRFMEPNLRMFDDYGVYLNRAVRLWVYTPSELTPPDGLHDDPNGGNIVYIQQVVAELLEYAYALHGRLAEAARDPLSDPREIARLRVLLAELPSVIDRHVHAGEIRDLLHQGYVQMGIPEMKEEIAALLDAKNDLVSYEDGQRASSWSTLLTFVFGLLAVPSVATDILTPVWKAMHWWRPKDADYEKVFFIAIAVGVVTVLLLGARKLLFRRKS